jgi:hypothetical protein
VAYALAAMHLLPAAGPRPAPLAWSVRLVAAAWVQLVALSLVAAYGALVIALWVPRLATWYAGLQLLVLGSALAAVVTAHQHRRDRATRAAAIIALVGAFANAVAIDGSLLLSV